MRSSREGTTPSSDSSAQGRPSLFNNLIPEFPFGYQPLEIAHKVAFLCIIGWTFVEVKPFVTYQKLLSAICGARSVVAICG
jgi:hypothetical protein